MESSRMGPHNGNFHHEVKSGDYKINRDESTPEYLIVFHPQEQPASLNRSWWCMPPHPDQPAVPWWSGRIKNFYYESITSILRMRFLDSELHKGGGLLHHLLHHHLCSLCSDYSHQAMFRWCTFFPAHHLHPVYHHPHIGSRNLFFPLHDPLSTLIWSSSISQIPEQLFVPGAVILWNEQDPSWWRGEREREWVSEWPILFFGQLNDLFNLFSFM